MKGFSVRRSVEDRAKFDVLHDGVPMTGYEGLDFATAGKTVQDLTRALYEKPEHVPATILVEVTPNPDLIPPGYAELFKRSGQYDKIVAGADGIPYYCFASGQPRRYADEELKYAVLVDPAHFANSDAVKAWATETWPAMMGRAPYLGQMGFERIGQITMGGHRWSDEKTRTVWTVEFRSVFTD